MPVLSIGSFLCLIAILSILTGSLVPALQNAFNGLLDVYFMASDTNSYGSSIRTDANNIDARIVYAFERSVNQILQLKTFKYEHIASHMNFYLYTRGNRLYPAKLDPSKPDTITGSEYKPQRKTVVLVHGFTTDALVASIVQTMKDELLIREDVNVIGVDYGPLTDIWWFHILPPVGMAINTLQAPWIGQCIGELISCLIDMGQSPDDVHLVGHSLGAHIAAFAGKYLNSVNRPIFRLTGLEPSSPGFSNVGTAHRLARYDAKFTDCIFTTAKSLAVGNNPCQANYYPNSCGISQPGCYQGDIP
ncbi:unnamed protein product, partial [Nesidiocoris tenuis]